MSAAQRKRAKQLIISSVTKKQSSEDKNEECVSLLTIPAISEQELDLAIQSISRENNEARFDLPNMFVVDYDIDYSLQELDIAMKEIKSCDSNINNSGRNLSTTEYDRDANNNTDCKIGGVADEVEQQISNEVDATNTSQNLEDPDYIPVEDNDDAAVTATTSKRPSRGHKRKNVDQNRDIRKRRANTNQNYVSAKGKLVNSRPFLGDYSCGCAKKCTEVLSVEERKAEFDKFWSAGCYEARCALIQGYVREIGKKRSYSVTSKRIYTRKYFIKNKEIYKQAFLNTFTISQAGIDNALKKKRNNLVTFG